MSQRKKPHVVVFLGGEPDSFKISEETGYWVCQYMPRASYDVTPVRITPKGKWQVPLGGLPAQGPVQKMLKHIFKAVPKISPRKGLERLLKRPADAFFTVLRGRGGDDGSMHGLASSINVPMVGSPQSVCQQTSDKYSCGRRVDGIVNSPLTRRFRQSDSMDAITREVQNEFVPPLFVKPVNAEASVGVEEVKSSDELRAAIGRARKAGDLLVQENTPGYEVNVTLFNDKKDKIHCLPPTVVVPKTAEYYDHEAKIRPGRVILNTPSSASNYLLGEAEDIAREVYDELGCRGVVSFDMSIKDNDTELLEVNTVPTLTRFTPLRQQLQAAGMHPSTLIDHLVRNAIL